MCREFDPDGEKKREAAAKDRSCVPRNDWHVRFDCESRQRGLNAIQRSDFSVYWTVVLSMSVTVRLTPEWSTWENARLVSFRREDRDGQPGFENAIGFILTNVSRKTFYWQSTIDKLSRRIGEPQNRAARYEWERRRIDVEMARKFEASLEMGQVPSAW